MVGRGAAKNVINRNKDLRGLDGQERGSYVNRRNAEGTIGLSAKANPVNGISKANPIMGASKTNVLINNATDVTKCSSVPKLMTKANGVEMLPLNKNGGVTQPQVKLGSVTNPFGKPRSMTDPLTKPINAPANVNKPSNAPGNVSKLPSNAPCNVNTSGNILCNMTNLVTKPAIPTNLSTPGVPTTNVNKPIVHNVNFRNNVHVTINGVEAPRNKRIQEDLLNLNSPEDDLHNTIGLHSNHESEGFNSPDENMATQLGKRQRVNRLVGRLGMVMNSNDVVDLPDAQEVGDHINAIEQQTSGEQTRNEDENARFGSGPPTAQSAANGVNQENEEGTSKKRGKGDRGKYKSYVVDMKLKGKQSKLVVYIPSDIDRAIGENARHLVNECGRVVRTRAPLNVKNWKEAFSAAGDGMWKEIEGKFQIKEGSSYLKLQAFVVDTMQHLYRLWKARLHHYYKTKECGATDEERIKNRPLDLPQDQWEFCVKHFGSAKFKKISERNSKNRRSEKRCKHTTGNLSFVEVEDLLVKENKGVKPSADVIWLTEHTHKNDQGLLEWADKSRSKEVYGKLKEAVNLHGDSMTQEEILLEVLEPRSGYFRGKGTALRGYSKGRQQLEQQSLVHEQQQDEKIQKQDDKIKELEENQEKTNKLLEEQKDQLAQQKEDFLNEITKMKEEFMRQISGYVTHD